MGGPKGVVVATGSRTVLGHIAQDVQEIGVTKSPLQEKIDRFANNIGIIIMVASALLFLIGILVGISAQDMFMTAVAAAVAAIPEGLPIVVTITLAIGVARMAQRHAIIRKLPAVETLGSTTVICTDKTGTLTKNEMTVKLVYDGEKIYELTGTGYDPKGEILEEGRPVKAGRRPSAGAALQDRPAVQRVQGLRGRGDLQGRRRPHRRRAHRCRHEGGVES